MSTNIADESPESRTSRRRLRACQHCDWVSALPALRPGQAAICPCCQHTLVRRHFRPIQRSLALASSALLALALAVYFPFVGFSALGLGQQIELLQTISRLFLSGQPVIAVVVALTIVILPCLYLLSVIWLQYSLLRQIQSTASRHIARALKHLHPWMMADVFIIGALVSLFKIAGMADITLGTGFWAFCSFTILLLLTMRSIDDDWMWFAIAGEPQAPIGSETGQTAAEQNLTGCPTCGLLQTLPDAGKAHCARCGELLHRRRPQSLQRTWALLLTSALLYIPANVYPIMYSTRIGITQPKTILGGVMDLITAGSWPIAMVIFIASVIVPIGKMFAIGWLCLRVGQQNVADRATRARLYRITELIGRWSMVDVFVVAILVTLIDAGQLLSINPGPGALAFAMVVILSMLAANSFDPRLIWDTQQPRTRSAIRSGESLND
ncbi:Paraquat-inducible protein A [Methylophaga frappieri]|uniref:Paraquat-inducible protein A n=1 Tax=Methylophaga frappieri (strain ATCC BAA-2434 / DSM 25690 / JAM7) TaxID=754477 RepID=I1YFY8_METFJ|nr:paraquat-inducible protein A [Methylophaga frappieri]AFJ01831.1 Paraquat-inducible protein A [Methylophaga frappieri]